VLFSKLGFEVDRVADESIKLRQIPVILSNSDVETLLRDVLAERFRRVGIDIRPERAIRWLTANAAKALGILDQTGTLEAGKMADVVLWNGNPFSVYAKADQVFIDGALVYDRSDPARQPVSDFELGQNLGVNQ
jgi:adenine deaminase